MRIKLILLGYMSLIIIVAGCALPTLYNKDYQQPTKGLLPYLQKGAMLNVSDLGYSVLVETVSDVERKPAEGQTWLLQVLNANGERVVSFTEDMTKLMHLIVVSRDLQFFAHVHPDYEGEGIFRVQFELPHGGEFLFITEFIPDRKGIAVHRQWIQGDGTPPPVKALEVNGVYEETVGNVTFDLSVWPSLRELRSGEMVMLNFSYRDAVTHELIELEPYLGTGGHCVIVDETATEYVHVHAVEGMVGPNSVMFHAEFPKPSIYKLWGQFQVKGEVLVVPFVIEV